MNLNSIILYIFAFLRPFTLILGEIKVASLNVLEIFSILISYCFIIVIIFNSRRFKFDFVTLAIIMFCVYCLMSVIWGSDAREVTRKLLPFLPFFAARTLMKDDKNIRTVLITLMLGFAFPIIGSVITTVLGHGQGYVVYQTGVKKFRGLFSSNHTFGHSVLFFNFIFALFIAKNGFTNILNKILMYFLMLCSLYCIVKAGVRTTYVGFIIFWFIFLWKFSKKYLAVLVFALCLVSLLSSNMVKELIYQTKNDKKIDIDEASSGRMKLWEHNKKVFLEMGIDRKLLGEGLGSEGSPVKIENGVIASSHNDYISLLMTLGVIGLLSFLVIYAAIGFDIVTSSIDIKLKYYFLALLMAVMVMNNLSNSYLARVELAQFFWFFMGLFYQFKWSAGRENSPVLEESALGITISLSKSNEFTGD